MSPSQHCLNIAISLPCSFADIPTACRESTAGRTQGLRHCVMHNVTCCNTGKWLLKFVCMVLETSASTELNRQGMNILVVKGTAQTGMKDIRTKATVITLARLGIGQLKESLKKNWKKDEHFDGLAIFWQ